VLDQKVCLQNNADEFNNAKPVLKANKNDGLAACKAAETECRLRCD
jgi:hypothetical protein